MARGRGREETASCANLLLVQHSGEVARDGACATMGLVGDDEVQSGSVLEGLRYYRARLIGGEYDPGVSSPQEGCDLFR